MHQTLSLCIQRRCTAETRRFSCKCRRGASMPADMHCGACRAPRLSHRGPPS